MSPTLSVIIVSKNDQTNLLKSYFSLKDILGEKVELVIQDYMGGSNFKKSVSEDKNVFLSEVFDSGTANAANIAVDNAKGKYIMFWGAGEQAIMPNFMDAVHSIEQDPVDILFNSTLIPEVNNTVATPDPTKMETDMQCATSGVMISRELFHYCGGLDTSYQIGSDYAMFINMLRQTSKYRVNPKPVVDFALGGMSSGPRGLEAIMEHELIRMRLCKKPPVLAAIDLGIIFGRYVRANVMTS